MRAVRHATRPDTAREDTRCRIALAAERLFRTLGYRKTGVADIARDLGMSPANVYRFYPTKGAINEAIAERLLDGLIVEADAIADAAGPATDRLTRLMAVLFDSKLRLFFEDRRLHDMATAAMAEHWGVIERYIGRLEAAVGRIVDAGIASGEFARLPVGPTARTLMHACIAWQHPALIEQCLTRRGQSVDELRMQLSEMTGFLLRGLRP